MIALALVPFACSLLLALTARRLARRLSPAVAALLLTLTALATALATGVVLCLAGFTALARISLVASLGGFRADHRPPWAAYSLPVPLPGGAIVVSAGMLRLLPADERRALLAHESAHLRRFHTGFVLLASLAAAASPLLRPAARQVRLAVELWADQLAAREVGDPQVVARALARASLAASRPRPGGFRLAVAESDVRARVGALAGLPPRLSPWAVASVAALAAAATAIAITLTFAVHHQIEVAQYLSARTTASR